MADRLFVYGTLRFPAVMRAVAGRLPRATQAMLDGHACFLANHGRFPGLVVAAGEQTEGLLYDAVDEAMLQRLDEFESSLFERDLVIVSSERAERRAWVYRLGVAHRHLLGETRFDAARFEREELPRWLLRLGLR